MQAVLEVTAGPHSGQQIVLNPGIPVRIGRTPKADYVVAEDTFLSGAHFYVEWSGEQCIVRDLSSSNGTFLNGTRLSEGVLHEGDVLTAGQSSFSLKANRLSDMTVMLPAVSHDDTSPFPPSPVPEPLQPVMLPPGAPPPPLSAFAVAPAPIPVSRLNASQRGMLETLRGLADPVYAVLDCAAAAAFVDAIRAAGGSIEVLSETANSGVVKMDTESPLAEQLAADGWGQGWGIYVTSRQPLVIVRNHLRRFQTILTPDGVEFQFRLHNPALLRSFLPALNGAEAKALFGPITAILVEGNTPNELLLFMPGPAGTLEKSLPLAEP
ncbi:MAG: FHA domain-containing protein [Bryobacteraceae bacterium]|jgi:hypothetical protein